MTRSYRAARRAALQEPVSFEYGYFDAADVEHVETFTCKGEISSLMLSEMAYHANLDVATEEGADIVRQVFSQAFGDDAEYQRFFRFYTPHPDDEQLMAILSGLIEDLVGRPTMQPSTSPATPLTNGPDSRGDSSQRQGRVLPFNIRAPYTVEDLPPLDEASPGLVVSSG